jgi:hypothetical protein
MSDPQSIRDRAPVRRASLAHEVEETGDVVVFDERGNRLLMLNAVGAAVWLLIGGERTVAEITSVLLETLSEDRARVEADVMQFVQSLHAQGVLDLP